MPDGSNLIVAGRTRHQIALADPTCKAVKTTLIDYHTLPFVNRNSSIVISEDDWVQMTNAGEHIINRTATTEHYRTYFTHNPITHAQAIEQGLVPIDPKTGQPTAAYIKGRQEAEHILAAKAEADAAAAAEAKAKAEKQLPGKTKWNTPSKKSKPLSDSETKQTLISVAGKTVSTDGTRPVLSLVTIQRKKGTEYTVATDARRLTVLSRSTTAPDTESDIEEVYNSKGEQAKTYHQHYPNWRQTIPLVSKHQASTTIDLSYYSFLAKGSVKGGYTKRIDSPFFNNGQHIFFNIGNHRAAINPVFMRDIYKQMQQLGKKLGFPPTLKAYYFEEKAPLLFTAEHNGITYQSVVMPQRVHALDENGNKIREGGNYVYKTPDITPGDIILGEQPTIYSEQETPTGSFSMRAKQEMQNVHDCINGLISDNKAGILHNRTYGDFSLAMGRKGKKGYGALHMHERRLQEGFTDDEAAFILVTALKAAESERYSEKKGNKMLFDRFGVRTVVAENPNGSKPIVTGFVLVSAGDESHAALPHTNFYALDELGSVQLVGASAKKALTLFDRIVNDNPLNWEQIISATIEELKKKQTAFKRGESYHGSPLDAFSQQETSVSSLSLRRSTERNATALLNERETTLLRVANYIKREADRTANVMGKDTEFQRAGVAFAQANAIINALDTHIFPQEHITKNSAEYRRLRALRNYLSEYIRIAAKGKLPVRRTTKDGHITIKAAIRELLETQLPAARNAAAQASQNRRVAITSYREEWKREPTSSGVYGNAADDEAA